MNFIPASVEFCDPQNFEAKPLFVWRNPTHESNAHLQASVAQWGVLHPIFVYKSADTILILDGCQRLRLAQQLGLSKIPFCFFDAAEWTLARLLALCVALHRSDSLHVLEKSRLLAAARSAVGQDFAISLAHELDVPEALIAACQRLSGVPSALQDVLAAQAWPLRTVCKFLDFSSEEQDRLAQTLHNWPLNANRWADILDALQDLRRREKTSADQILSDVLASLPQNLPLEQQEKALRESLRARRNPHYHQKLHEFLALSKPLAKQAGAQIVHTPFFEDDAVEIHSRLQNQQDRQKLVLMLQNPAWDKILPN